MKSGLEIQPNYSRSVMTSPVMFATFKSIYEKIPVEHVPHSVTEKPLLSVCVVTYQHEDYIVDCLEGILMQNTSFPIEVILGEDCSKDKTREICQAYALKYPDKIRLLLHHRENNIKISGKATGRFNLIYSLLSAKGKYIALCEGDDFWTDPSKLQGQVDFLEQNKGCSLTYHPWVNLDDDSIQITTNFASQSLGFSPRTATLVFRNYITDINLEMLCTAPNGDTALRFALQGMGQFKLLKNIGPAVRRTHPGSLMGTLSKVEKIPRRIDTYLALLKAYTGTNREPLIREKLLQFIIIYGVYQFKAAPLENWKEVVRSFSLALKSKRVMYFLSTLLNG